MEKPYTRKKPKIRQITPKESLQSKKLDREKIP
jgi:hypothetical protein